MAGRIIFINGTVNSGKSTIARALSEAIPSGIYIDGDDLIERSGKSFDERVSKTVKVATEKGCSLAKAGKNVCIAYPLRDEDWETISQICRIEGVEAKVVTLAPSENTTLSNRGERQLNTIERQRVSQMFLEGYHTRSFSNLIVENDLKTPDQTVGEIRKFFGI